MRNLAGFREAVEQYCKRMRRTQKDLAAALYLTEGDLNKRLHDYSHPASRRTWRLQPRHVQTIVETLARWGAITARKQALDLFALLDFSTVAEAIDWQATPWSKLHASASPTESLTPHARSVRRRIFQAPDVPKGHILRPKPFEEIKALLLTPEIRQATAITTALRGAGGFGKTTLASAICHDPKIQEAFPDGILWAELGEHPPAPLVVLNDLLRVLEPSERASVTLEGARARWRNALEERVYLLVIDDVWQTEVLDELLEGGPQCRRLITTRNDQVLPPAATRVWVDAMEPEEAMALLCQDTREDWRHALDRAVLKEVVVEQLGCWPLLVSLANGQFRLSVERLSKTPQDALVEIRDTYQQRGMTAFKLGDGKKRQQTVKACLEVSLEHLEAWTPDFYEARQRYLELAVFPEDTPLSLSTLQIYWQGTGQLRASETERLCLLLSDLSLLLPSSGEQTTIRLHDVLRTYLIQQAGKQLPNLHQRLLDAHHHHHHLTRWADLPQSEAYLWQNLMSHLSQAGNQEALQRENPH